MGVYSRFRCHVYTFAKQRDNDSYVSD